MIAKLAEPELSEALATLPHWTVDEARMAIARSFRFIDFTEAFAFMTRVALIAESIDHHPDWANRYNRVDIRLTTHDAGGLSVRDIELARTIDEIAAVSAQSER